MVTPSRVANVDARRSVLDQEIGDHSQSAGSRKSLERSNSARCNISVIPSEEDTTRSLQKCLVSINRCILLVESSIIGNSLFSFSNNGEYEWLSILRSVSSNTKVYFLLEFIVFVSSRQREDRVSRGLSNMTELSFSETLGSLFLRVELFIKLG